MTRFFTDFCSTIFELLTPEIRQFSDLPKPVLHLRAHHLQAFGRWREYLFLERSCRNLVIFAILYIKLFIFSLTTAVGFGVPLQFLVPSVL